MRRLAEFMRTETADILAVAIFIILSILGACIQ